MSVCLAVLNDRLLVSCGSQQQYLILKFHSTSGKDLSIAELDLITELIMHRQTAGEEFLHSFRDF